MKTLKYIFSLCLLVLLVNSCVEDESNTDFINTAVAPTNVLALFEVTQDNTGTVTITPTAEGAIGFNIFYGDGTAEPIDISQGENTTHIYEEGTYTVTVVAVGPTGLETEITQQLVVTFDPPVNLVVTAENDLGVSKQVNVTASADNAISYSVDFGDGSELMMSNIGETVSYIYANPGLYTITVVAMGAAIETTEFVITDFEVTAIVQPLDSAPTPPARDAQDVISIFSSAYTNVANPDYFPDWGQGGQGSAWALFDLSGDEILQYINLSYQGVDFGEEIDASQMEYLHLDVWTADVIEDLEVSAIRTGPVENAVTLPLTADQWTSIDIPMSAYTDQGLTLADLIQLKFVAPNQWAAGTVFIDNIYFYKEASVPTSVAGTWKVAPEAGSLAVGPSAGSSEWWAIDDAGVTQRACFYDDTYVFGSDGSFNNVLGVDTWIEGWQGSADSCGSPVAPHDGSNAATYVHDETAGTITINGTGAYLGIPKPINTGELSNPADAPASITYTITLADINTMIVGIEAGSGTFWTYKLIRDGAVASPMAGTWTVAPEAGSLAVGPTEGSSEWWSIDDAGVTQRACFYDDTFVFGTDGTFSNVQGADTWVEAWQGVGADSCSTPVAPHDGSNAATYSYDASAGTVTLNGTGSYLGIPKPINTGELSSPADAPASITYNVDFIDSNTVTISIEAGPGVFWMYKLVKI